jgi:hypothetical protein
LIRPGTRQAACHTAASLTWGGVAVVWCGVLCAAQGSASLLWWCQSRAAVLACPRALCCSCVIEWAIQDAVSMKTSRCCQTGEGGHTVTVLFSSCEAY